MKNRTEFLTFLQAINYDKLIWEIWLNQNQQVKNVSHTNPEYFSLAECVINISLHVYYNINTFVNTLTLLTLLLRLQIDKVKGNAC